MPGNADASVEVVVEEVTGTRVRIAVFGHDRGLANLACTRRPIGVVGKVVVGQQEVAFAGALPDSVARGGEKLRCDP